MAWDALRMRNTIQLIALLVFHLALVAFASLQAYETWFESPAVCLLLSGLNMRPRYSIKDSCGKLVSLSHFCHLQSRLSTAKGDLSPLMGSSGALPYRRAMCHLLVLVCHGCRRTLPLLRVWVGCVPSWGGRGLSIWSGGPSSTWLAQVRRRKLCINTIKARHISCGRSYINLTSSQL
jgi:hypothetical protein